MNEFFSTCQIQISFSIIRTQTDKDWCGDQSSPSAHPTHPSYALSLSICPVVPRKLGLYNQLWEPNPIRPHWLRIINFIILVQISLFFLTVSRFLAKYLLLKSICREKYFLKIILPDIYLKCIFFTWPIEPNPI